MRRRDRKRIKREVAGAQAASDNFNNSYPVLANEIGASAFTDVFGIMELLASRIVALEAQTHQEEK